MSQSEVRIGVDVGGTFTDFVLLNAADEAVYYHKVPSTPADPSNAIGGGVQELLALASVPASAVSYLGHGTTVATNMVIEGSGAKAALLTTRGFRDVLEIGRQTRPHLYDYRAGKPAPLIRRAHRFEVRERMSSSGEVLVPLESKAIDAIIDELRAQDIEAVAVALLHAYRNPAHEEMMVQALRAALPGVYVCASSQVSPEYREFERTSTTVINAFIGPRMTRYVARLEERMRDLGLGVMPHTVQSNGGLMTTEDVCQLPVKTCLSGPASGVVAAAAIGTVTGYDDLIAFDVGGTSTDVSLVMNGEPATTAERSMCGHPVRSPMIDVHVIGAGGGSIAYIDDAGGLKVGPQSAGASPGPMAYGRGGKRVTLTDANVVLGRLNPSALLSGRLAIDAEAARQGVAQQVARHLGQSLVDAAQGIVSVAVANIARAIRSVSTERGMDPSSLALLAYGGAGPVHAVDVAREVDCATVIVPREPGTLCARGILLADLRTDLVRSLVVEASVENWRTLLDVYENLYGQANEWLERQGVSLANRSVQPIIEARYRGQSFEIPVFIDDVRSVTVDALIVGFHRAHRRTYGYDIPQRAITIVNCRLRVAGVGEKAPLTPLAVEAPTDTVTIEERALLGARNVYVGEAEQWQSAPVYARDMLKPGDKIQGLAVIEEMSSTTFLSPLDSLEVDVFGNLIVCVGTLPLAGGVYVS